MVGASIFTGQSRNQLEGYWDAFETANIIENNKKDLHAHAF